MILLFFLPFILTLGFKNFLLMDQNKSNQNQALSLLWVTKFFVNWSTVFPMIADLFSKPEVDNY